MQSGGRQVSGSHSDARVWLIALEDVAACQWLEVCSALALSRSLIPSIVLLQAGRRGQWLQAAEGQLGQRP